MSAGGEACRSPRPGSACCSCSVPSRSIVVRLLEFEGRPDDGAAHRGRRRRGDERIRERLAGQELGDGAALGGGAVVGHGDHRSGFHGRQHALGGQRLERIAIRRPVGAGVVTLRAAFACRGRRRPGPARRQRPRQPRTKTMPIAMRCVMGRDYTSSSGNQTSGIGNQGWSQALGVRPWASATDCRCLAAQRLCRSRALASIARTRRGGSARARIRGRSVGASTST